MIRDVFDFFRIIRNFSEIFAPLLIVCRFVLFFVPLLVVKKFIYGLPLIRAFVRYVKAKRYYGDTKAPYCEIPATAFTLLLVSTIH